MKAFNMFTEEKDDIRRPIVIRQKYKLFSLFAGNDGIYPVHGTAVRLLMKYT
jgi:hypothetical protein